MLHGFTGADGADPAAGVIFDSSGALYSTTMYGGKDFFCCSLKAFGNGTVFKLTPPRAPGGAWTESVLHSFTGGSDGAHPYAGLIFDRAGALYGTTEGGGAYGYGTVFKLTRQRLRAVPGPKPCCTVSRRPMTEPIPILV